MSELAHKNSWKHSLLIGLLSAIPLVLVNLLASDNFNFVPYSIHPLHDDGVWYNTLHLGTRAYESWLLLFPTKPLLLTVILGFCFTTLVDRILSKEPMSQRMPCAMAPTAILFIAGNDFVLFSACFVFALLLAYFISVIEGQPSFFFALPVFTSFAVILIGQELAFPLALCAVISIPVLAGITQRGSPVSISAYTQLLFTCLIPAIAILVFKKEHIFPLYPMTQQVHPIVAPFGPVNLIDRTVIRSLWGGFSQLLFGLVLLQALIHFPDHKRRKGLAVLITLILTLVVDTSFPEELSQLGPLAGASRLFTDLYFIPVAPVVSCIALILAIIFGLQSKAGSIVTAVFLVSLPASLPLMLPAQAGFPVVKSLAHQLPAQCMNSKIATSPSFDVIAEEKLFYLCEKTLPRRILLTEKIAGVTTSLKNRQKRARRILDGNLNKRWHTRQSGTEWIEIDLKAPRTIAGIQFLQDRWPGDYPESITVKTARTCADGTFTSVLSWNASQAHSMQLTEDGYPYSSTGKNVAGFWQPKGSIGCIRIEQNGKSKRLWSLAGISIVEIDG